MTSPFNASNEARGAAVTAARGWFRLAPAEGMASGAANVRAAGALVVSQWGDGLYRVMTQGTTSLALSCGPYEDATRADQVAAACLALAYDDLGWPTGGLLGGLLG